MSAGPADRRPHTPAFQSVATRIGSSGWQIDRSPPGSVLSQTPGYARLAELVFAYPGLHHFANFVAINPAFVRRRPSLFRQRRNRFDRF